MGATPRVTTGIARALASGESTAICWKNSRVSGNSATVATHCVRLASRRCAQAPRGQDGRSPSAFRASGRRRSPATNNMPTAMNDSQNPACRTAHGSHSSTAVSASAITSRQSARRPRWRRISTTASINRVRCAGTPQPAIRA